MKWENKAEDQVLYPKLCFFKYAPPRMAFPALLLLFASYLLGFGFFSIFLTSVVLVVSTALVLQLANQRPAAMVDDKCVEENSRNDGKESSDQMEDSASTELPTNETETAEDLKQAQEKEGICHQMVGESTPSLDFLSESESQDHTILSSSTADSEGDWPLIDKNEESPDSTDGSISDEDSLIEIALPSGNYVGHQKQDPKLNLFPNDQSIFSQQMLMGFLTELNEMNEEENLIEIDISMGSIKYSRFEIQA